MKKIPLYVFLFVLACSAWSCLPPPIDIDVKPADPKMVIASQVLGNQGLIVGLTRSYSPLDTSGSNDSVSSNLLNSILVSNAIVTVSYLSSVDTLYMASPGLYINLFVQLYDDVTYTLHAKDPATGEEVSAVTTLEPQITFDTVYPFIERLASDTFVHFHYTLTDFPNDENYYVVNFVKKVQGDSTFDIGTVFAQGNNQLLTEFDLLDDQAFDANGRLTKDTWVRSLGQTDTSAAVVSHISKGYYEFLTAYKRSGSVFNQLTGEPINYPTNVNGGHGYFTMHRQQAFIFDLNLY
ncbi:MAG: hypothetical protein FD123_204 [Bacteroidetes bacterium]|nr:MAG: hypothetical protein FD123_204 [Bacteroidota bacterium]